MNKKVLISVLIVIVIIIISVILKVSVTSSGTKTKKQGDSKLPNEYCQYDGNHPSEAVLDVCGNCAICEKEIGYASDTLCEKCAKEYHRCRKCGLKLK